MVEPDIQAILLYVGGTILAGGATIAFVATALSRLPRRRSRRDDGVDELPTIDF